MIVTTTILEDKMKSANIAFLIFCLLCSSCDKIAGCTEKEIQRIKSPDLKVDAVLVERDCGATTSVNKSVFLTPSGKSLEDRHPVFVSYKVDGLDIKWLEPKILTIEYDAARILDYTNFWAVRDLDNFEYEVKIVEREKK